MTSTNKNSIPDTQCLKIKYIFICSMKKQMMFYNSKLRKTEKQRKSAFPNLGRTKNGRKRPSQHWENWKTAKNDFPNIGKIKKRHRLHFPPLGKLKNAENHSSLVSEIQKLPKTAFRLQATSEKHWKQHFAHKRNAENAKNTRIRGWNQENGENWFSAAAENQKQANSAFRPRRTDKKRQKLAFGHGRRVKNSKKSISAVAEMQKMRKTGLRPRPKNQKRQKLTFGHGRKAIIH